MSGVAANCGRRLARSWDRGGRWSSDVAIAPSGDSFFEVSGSLEQFGLDGLQQFQLGHLKLRALLLVGGLLAAPLPWLLVGRRFFGGLVLLFFECLNQTLQTGNRPLRRFLHRRIGFVFFQAGSGLIHIAGGEFESQRKDSQAADTTGDRPRFGRQQFLLGGQVSQSQPLAPGELRVFLLQTLIEEDVLDHPPLAVE